MVFSYQSNILKNPSSSKPLQPWNPQKIIYNWILKIQIRYQRATKNSSIALTLSLSLEITHAKSLPKKLPSGWRPCDRACLQWSLSASSSSSSFLFKCWSCRWGRGIVKNGAMGEQRCFKNRLPKEAVDVHHAYLKCVKVFMKLPPWRSSSFFFFLFFYLFYCLDCCYWLLVYEDDGWEGNTFCVEMLRWD